MEVDRLYLEMALREAEEAARDGTYPIGAVLVDPYGQVLCRGRNRVFTDGDDTAHAEIDVLRKAGPRIWEPPYRGACTLYTSMEPCPMCAGALVLTHIARVVWATSDDHLGAVRKMKQGPHFLERFDDLAFTAAPFPDLDLRQRHLMAEFDNRRGRDGSFWLNERAEK